MRNSKNMIGIFLFLIALFTASNTLLVAEDTVLKLFIDTDTLTLYFTGDEPVDIENLVFEVTANDDTVARTIAKYSTFAMFGNTPVPAQFCLLLRRSGSTSPLSQDCNSSQTVTQNLASSDIFWYSSVEAQYRTITVKWDGKVEICGAGQTSCEISLSGSGSTPTPEPTSAPSCIDMAQSGIPESNEAWIEIRNTQDDCTESQMVLVPMGMDTDAFWIGQYEVSQTDYARCNHPDCATIAIDHPDHPVANITIEQAEAYCTWFGSESSESNRIRLPFIEEWKYAAQGVDEWVYPWGNDSTDIEDKAIYSANSLKDSVRSPIDVDTQLDNSASWVGAYHLVGNVAEWVISEAEYISTGGSFRDIEDDIIITGYFPTNISTDSTGFRCVKEIDIE